MSGGGDKKKETKSLQRSFEIVQGQILGEKKTSDPPQICWRSKRLVWPLGWQVPRFAFARRRDWLFGRERGGRLVWLWIQRRLVNWNGANTFGDGLGRGEKKKPRKATKMPKLSGDVGNERKTNKQKKTRFMSMIATSFLTASAFLQNTWR